MMMPPVAICSMFTNSAAAASVPAIDLPSSFGASCPTAVVADELFGFASFVNNAVTEAIAGSKCRVHVYLNMPAIINGVLVKRHLASYPRHGTSSPYHDAG